MRNQQQNDSQITPWSFDQNIPNRIIQYQNIYKTTRKERNQQIDRKSIKMSSNFQKFLQRRQLKATQKMNQKVQSQQKAKQNSSKMKKIQITNIQPPQNLQMNETFRLSQMFPSFSLNRMEKGLTFYKEKYFSIQKPQLKEQTIKIQPLRRSLQSDYQQKSTLQLCKQLKIGRITYHLSMINKSFRDKILKTSICNKSIDQRGQLNKPFSIQSKKIDKLQRSKRKSKRYEEILQILQKKKQKNIERCKTDGPVQLDKCLKSKRQLYQNLPKIQFIQISQ